MTTQSKHTFATATRGIDHLVLASRDLAAQAKAYARLGFTVGPRNRHPWGTENHIIQFDGSFLELISIGDGAAIPPFTPRHFSFGAFLRDYLIDREGFAMLALESQDAEVDAVRFQEAKIGDFKPFFFEREGRRADGLPTRVAFTLAFARSPLAERAGFFVCQQHEPQNFWNRAVQKHRNGVTGIQSVVMVAEDPSDLHEFLGAFVNQRVMRSTSYGLELDTGRGFVEVLSPEAFQYRFNQPAPDVRGNHAQFAGVVFDTQDLESARVDVAASGMVFDQVGEITVVPADQTHGVLLAFAAKATA